MTTISNILTPRREVLEGKFQGALQAHQVHSRTQRLESDAELLFGATYPTNGLRNVVDRCRQKLYDKDHQGGFLLAGPYGAGKTHALIVLYHLFNTPKASKGWLSEWHIDFDDPDSSRAVILSTSEVDADRLWVPVFERLGKEDLLAEVKRYPTIPLIEELAEGQPLAIFLDEIETWYGSLSRDEPEIIEQNQMFIQNLLEVAADQDQKVFVFVTLLNKNDELKQILLRTNPVHEDLSASGDRERLILHRLVETPRDEIDLKAVSAIAKSYIDDYEYPIEIEEPARYRQRIEETYPFHPQLLSLIDRIYESAAERQNVRGAMNVLADVLRDSHDRVDLILTSQLDEAAFRGINMELVHRFNYDALDNEDTREIDYTKEILRTVLLYTLDEKSRAATVSDIMLGVFRPDRFSLNDLSMCLTELIGRAHYLHREDGHFMIREGLNIIALVDREARRMEDVEEAEKELYRLVRSAVFSGDVEVFEGAEEVEDRPGIKYMVMLAAPESPGELGEMLEEVYRGRRYQNTLIFITQDGPSILADREVLDKAKRIAAAISLPNRIEDPQGELVDLIKEERSELATTLRGRFGRLIQWSKEGEAAQLRLRQIPTQPSVADVREKIGTDRSYVADHILEELKGAQGGRRVESLLNDFRRFRRLPVLLDDEIFYGAIRTLFQDGRVVLEGDKSKMYVPGRDAPPRRISDDLTVHHPDHVPDYILNPPEVPEGEEETIVDLVEGEEGPIVTRRAVIEHVPIEGNSPRSIVSMAEARINEAKDRIRSIKASFRFDEPISKEQLLNLLEGLPPASHISTDLEVERDKSED